MNLPAIGRRAVGRCKQAAAWWDALWQNASRTKKNALYVLGYTVIFALTACFVFSAFWVEGKSFVWQPDGRAQHYTALSYIGSYLREIIGNFAAGDFTVPMFDFSLNMGADILTTLNYYGLGDPLTLLSAAVPSEYTPVLYDVLVILRFYLAGLSFSAFCLYRERGYFATLLGALVCIFGGYALFAGVRHPFFLNPMIYLPLLLIGLDKILRGGRPYLLIIITFLSACSGFYFFYMMTIFLVIYGLFRFFDLYGDRPKKTGLFFGVFSKSAGFYLIGVLLSCVIFLPEIVCYLESSRMDSGYVANLLSYSNDTYPRWLLGTISAPGSWQYPALAPLCFLSVILLFLQRRNYRSLKWGFLLLTVFFLVPFFGYLFNGFGYVINRWSFAYAMLAGYILATVFPKFQKLSGPAAWLMAGGVLAYGIVCFAYRSSLKQYFYLTLAMLAVTLLVVCGFAFFPCREKWRPLKKRLYKPGMLLLTCVCVALSGIQLYSPDYYRYVNDFIDRGSVINTLEENSALTAAELENPEGDFYRISTAGLSINTANTPVNLDYNGTSGYFSLVNRYGSQYQFDLENIGQQSSFMAMGFNGSAILNTLACVRYHTVKSDNVSDVPYGYTLLTTREREDGKLDAVFENQCALPIGYTYSSYIIEEEYAALNPVQKQEAMMQSAVVEQPAELPKGEPSYLSQQIPYTITGEQDLRVEEGKVIADKGGATLEITFDGLPASETYVRLMGLTIDKITTGSGEIAIYGEQEKDVAKVRSKRDNMAYGRENYLANLGYSETGQTTCRIVFPAGGEYGLEGIEVYCLPMEEYYSQAFELGRESLTDVVIEDNQISGNIDLSSQKLLCMSVPYSEGWKAWVDGEPAQVLRVNGMYMGLLLPAGEHTVTFSYRTPYLAVGALVSAAGVFALIGVILFRSRNFRRRNKIKNPAAKQPPESGCFAPEGK